jgi:hypothetical protein
VIRLSGNILTYSVFPQSKVAGTNLVIRTKFSFSRLEPFYYLKAHLSFWAISITSCPVPMWLGKAAWLALPSATFEQPKLSLYVMVLENQAITL